MPLCDTDHKAAPARTCDLGHAITILTVDTLDDPWY